MSTHPPRDDHGRPAAGLESHPADPFMDWVEALVNRIACELALDDRSAALPSTARLDLEIAAEALETSADRTAARVGAAARALWRADAPAAFVPRLEDLQRALNDWRRGVADHGDDGSAQVATAGAPSPVAPPAGAHEDECIAAEVLALQADAELSSMFFAEALDHLGTIEATVLQLESTPGDVKLLNDLFRPFHTVKGNAGALGLTRVQELAHKVENLLDLCRSGRHDMGPAETDVVLAAVDVLTALLNDLSARVAGQPGTSHEAARVALLGEVEAVITGTKRAEATAAAPPPAGDEPTSDEAVASPAAASPAPPPAPAPAPVGSAMVSPVASPAAGAALATAPTREGAAPDRGMRSHDVAAQVKVDTRKLDNLVDMVGELVIAQSIIQADPGLRGADQRLTRQLAQLKRITSELQRTAMSMRMVPIRQTFQKMARLVRDLGKQSGKAIDLTLSGEDTELDRRVVEDINDPLMHMVRNSVDHGIEPADARVRQGKPPEGRLALSAYHQGGAIVITIADDGAGLNTERILAKARAQGIVGEGETLTPAEIHQLIFRPGFSTAEKVTEISGRGVGMDVVRRNIEALRGRIEIQTAPGEGTTFLIRLPLTLAIVDGLMLGVGGRTFVMPTFAVRESLRPSREQVHLVQGEPRLIQVRDRLIPLLRLSDLFNIAPRCPDAWASTVVVIEDEGQRVGVVVDELLGKQEVVIKSLGQAFADVRGVAGGAILGDGRVGLILDAHGIVGCLTGEAGRAA